MKYFFIYFLKNIILLYCKILNSNSKKKMNSDPKKMNSTIKYLVERNKTNINHYFGSIGGVVVEYPKSLQLLRDFLTALYKKHGEHLRRVDFFFRGNWVALPSAKTKLYLYFLEIKLDMKEIGIVYPYDNKYDIS